MSSMIMACALAFALMPNAAAFASSPVGRWLTFDEANGDTLAIVKIFETENGLAGEIEKLFLRPHAGANGRCARCPGEWRNQPIIGLQFMQNFAPHGNEWRNGDLLDPASGKLYNASLSLDEAGDLKIIVSIGPFGLLKRTQTWRRPAGVESKASVEGLWQIFNEEYGVPSSIIQIAQREGKLEGRVLQTFLLPDEGPEARCLACQEDLYEQKIVGMRILSNMNKQGNKWAGGKILDPGNGKSYSCSLWLEEENRLKVRGHLGPFTRTQVWQRAQE